MGWGSFRPQALGGRRWQACSTRIPSDSRAAVLPVLLVPTSASPPPVLPPITDSPLEVREEGVGVVLQLFLRANKIVEDKNIRLQDLVKPNTFLSSTLISSSQTTNSLLLTEELIGIPDFIVKTRKRNEQCGRHRVQIGCSFAFLTLEEPQGSVTR